VSKKAFAIDAQTWPVIRALLDAPGTARDLAERTGLPLAKVVRDLDRLRKSRLLVERGVRTVGRYQERIYDIADESLEASLSSLQTVLREIERGMIKVGRNEGQGFLSLVIKRVDLARAHRYLSEMAALRREYEAMPEDEGGILLSIVLGSWVEREVQ